MTISYDDNKSLVHPTAVISRGAEIGKDVSIGAYSVIGPHVRLGDGCKVAPHVVIEGHTTIGKNNRFFQFASVGAEPQDYTYKGEPTQLIIGDNNTFRECVTLNCGTLKEKGITSIGSNNLLMAYVHIGHDSVIGNFCTIANSCNIAGHVRIGDRVTIGGSTSVSQFVTLGRGCYIGGASGIDHDIPIFCTAMGNRVRLKGINIIGMKRQGYQKQVISEVVEFLRSIETSGLSPRAFIERDDLMQEFKSNEIIMEMRADILKSEIGIAPFMS